MNVGLYNFNQFSYHHTYKMEIFHIYQSYTVRLKIILIKCFATIQYHE